MIDPTTSADWDGELALTTNYTEGSIEVFLTVSRTLSNSVARAFPDDYFPTQQLLMKLEPAKNLAAIFPIITYSSDQLYQPKYGNIRSIWFDFDPDDYKNRFASEISDYIKHGLPRGFIADPAYGLGLTKELRPVVDAISRIDNVNRILISGDDAPKFQAGLFTISTADYSNIALTFGRITRYNQKESLAERQLLAHNEILSKLDAKTFPIRERKYVAGTIFKLVGGANASQTILRGSDRKALLEAVTGNAKAIAERDPREFVQLQKDIELVSLDSLISSFERALLKNFSESAWQSVLELNPFILSMVFGYPIVVVQSGASVGGGRLEGSGTKIADFLSENSTTHNVALVEIKKATTPLSGTQYRTGVWSPSAELIGAVVQVLDQRLKFVTDIAGTKHRSKLPDIQAYAVDCVILAGRTPANEEMISSFELFRNQLKDVRIVTFDELLGKLMLLRELLSGERYVSDIDSEPDKEPEPEPDKEPEPEPEPDKEPDKEIFGDEEFEAFDNLKF